MKICLLGDTHFGARNDSIVFRTYFKNFYTNIFFPHLVKNNIKVIIQLGDFFDRRKYINFVTNQFIKEVFIDQAKMYGIEIIQLLGNHDIYYKNTLSINAPSQLTKHYDHFKVIDKPQTLDFDGTKIDIIPWICPENQEQISNFMATSTSNILCGHLELRGFQMHKGVIADHGMNHNIFSKYKKVFSGHYHSRSIKDNIHYLGVPYELTWSDCDEQKGFAIFDTDTQDYDFIPNHLKLHHKITYNDTVNDYTNFNASKYNNSYIKIFIEKKTDEQAFESFITSIYDCSPVSVGISDISNIQNTNTNISITTESPIEILLNYISHDNQEEEKIIKNMVRQIHNKALTQGAIE